MACLLVEASLLGVGIDDLDEGYFIQQATRVLHGQLPYRDFATLYAPGLAFLHAGVFALLGGPSLLAPRVLACLARAGLVLTLFGLTRPLVRNPWWAALPGVVLLLGLDDAPVRWEPHPGWLSSLAAILAVWCAAHQTNGWRLISGLLAALAYVFKQNTGVFILAAVLIWTWPRSAWPAAAFGLGTAAWLAALLMAGVQVQQLGVLVGAVNEASLVSAPEPTVLIPLAALIGGFWLLRRDSQPRVRLYLLGGTALFLTEFPRMDTQHLAWSAPLLLVLGAAALERVPRALAIACVGATLVLVRPTLTSRLAYMAGPRSEVAGVSAPAQTASDIQTTVDDIRARTAPDEPVFVYPTSPLLYVLAQRTNPTRFDHLNPGAATPTEIDQIITDLQNTQVRLVVISDFWEAAWGPPGANAALEGWLADHYSEVDRHGTYRVLQPDL